MKKFLFLFTFIIAELSTLFAQDTISKVIIIDSVILDKGVNEKYLKDRLSLFDKNESKIGIADNFQFTGCSGPIICKVKFPKSDDLSMTMLIDNRNSRIELHHMEGLGDTIRISKYKIYRNCLTDSSVSSSFYYHMINGRIISTYKHKESKTFGGKRCDSLKELLITINEFVCTVPLQIMKAQNVQINCGCLKKRDEKKEAKYWNAGISGKRIKYNRVSYSYCDYYNSYRGKLDFSKN